MVARRAVSWPQLPKMAFFEPQSAVFGPEIIIFRTFSKMFCYHHDWALKRQCFRVGDGDGDGDGDDDDYHYQYY